MLARLRVERSRVLDAGRSIIDSDSNDDFILSAVHELRADRRQIDYAIDFVSNFGGGVDQGPRVGDEVG